MSLIRAAAYMVSQCGGAICGVGLVKLFMTRSYNMHGGGANSVAPGFSTTTGLGAEIIGSFVLVYTVFSATDPKRSARESFIPVSFLQQLLHYLVPLSLSLHVYMLKIINEILGFGAVANWVSCVHGASSHHPNHGHWH